MATAMPYLFSPEAHSHLVPYLAALQGSCITHDRTISTFLPPLNHEKLLSYWKEKIAEVAAGTRAILILLEESEPGSRAKGTELKGVVMLSMPSTETGPFRAYVESLLISPKFRRQGAARSLMETLEVHSIGRGKTLLVGPELDQSSKSD